MSLADSTSSDPVQTIVDLLDGADASLWTNASPIVEAFEDSSQQTKEHRRDPALYCWSPVDGNFEEFDAEYSHRETGETIEIQVWCLGDSHADGQVDANQYASDIVSILDEYARDNYNRTQWHQIKPDSVTDERAGKPYRDTDHFILRVQCTLDSLDETGVGA